MKKRIPIGLRKVLEQYSKYNNHLFEVSVAESPIVKFTDIDSDSDYFFEVLEIVNTETTNGKPAYNISYLPSSEESLKPISRTVILKYIPEHFNKWLNLLELSNEESIMFDDNFTKTYYDDLEENFKIIDHDAGIKPFSIYQQKKILLFLNKAKSIVNSEQENSEDKTQTIELINKTQKELSTTTKQKVVNNIRKILAKSFKLGIQIGEKLLIEFTTELAKKLILGS